LGRGREELFSGDLGCQMNDHDSEKVAGLLLSRGYQQVETPEAASLILYNTCSIREKAAQKVFSRLGEYRESRVTPRLSDAGLRGATGRRRYFKRAPWVSLVCGFSQLQQVAGDAGAVGGWNQRVTGWIPTRMKRLKPP